MPIGVILTVRVRTHLLINNFYFHRKVLDVSEETLFLSIPGTLTKQSILLADTKQQANSKTGHSWTRQPFYKPTEFIPVTENCEKI